MDLLKVKKLSPNAIIPTRSTLGCAGYDLYSSVSCLIPPGELKKIETDIAIEFPEGHFAHILPRSGLTINKKFIIGAGVIDHDYRGNICVVIINTGKMNECIYKGDKIAQLVLQKISTPEIEEVSELNDTERGTNGFGSTGD